MLLLLAAVAATTCCFWFRFCFCLFQFMAFAEGFDRLFHIMLAEDMTGVIVEDCLEVANNMLLDCEVAQKLFAQSRNISLVPRLLQQAMVPRQRLGGGAGSDGASSGNGSSTAGIALTLKLIERLVLVPGTFAAPVAAAAADMLEQPPVPAREAGEGDAFVVRDREREAAAAAARKGGSGAGAGGDADDDDVMRKRRLGQLTQMQDALAAQDGLLAALVELALGPTLSDEALKRRAMQSLGWVIVGHARNQMSLCELFINLGGG